MTCTVDMQSPTGSTATNSPASLDVRNAVIICNQQNWQRQNLKIGSEQWGIGHNGSKAVYITAAVKVLIAVISTERATFPLLHDEINIKTTSARIIRRDIMMQKLTVQDTWWDCSMCLQGSSQPVSGRQHNTGATLAACSRRILTTALPASKLSIQADLRNHIYSNMPY